ncbi:hypothetical protein ACG7XA_002573 [Enterococcus faecium]
METKNYFSKMFYIYFFLMFIGKRFGTSETEQYKYILIVSVFFFLLKFCLDKFSLKEIVILTGVLGYGIISVIFNGKVALLFTIITLCGMKNIELRKIYQTMLIAEIFLFSYNLCRYFISDKSQYVIFTERANFGKTIESMRCSLGFVHPNSMHLNYFILVTLIVLLFVKFRTILGYSLLFLLNIYFYWIGGSRTGVILVTLFLFFSYLLSFEITKKIIIRMKYYFSFFPILFSTLTIWIVYNYSNYLWIKQLDQSLQHRIQFSNIFLKQHAIRLFGNRFEFDGKVIIDSGYVELFLKVGFLAFILFCIVHFLVIQKLISSHMHYELVVLLVSLIYCCIEPFDINIFMNYSLIYISLIIFNNDINVVSNF